MREHNRIRKQNRLLIINYDDSDFNPRREQENVSVMKIQWNRYTLGDNPEITPDEYLKQMCHQEFINDKNWKKAITYLKKNDRLVYNRKQKCWCNRSTWRGETYTDEIYGAENGLVNTWRLRDALIDLMDNKEMMDILTKMDHEFQILSMYEHSGLALSQGVNRGWDSGTCGFCEVTKKDAIKNGITKNWRKWAHKIIDEEVKEYDDYLHGECYSCTMYEMPESEYASRIADGESAEDIDIENEGNETIRVGGFIGSEGLKEIESMLN